MRHNRGPSRNDFATLAGPQPCPAPAAALYPTHPGNSVPALPLRPASAPPLGDSYKFLSLSSRGNLQADFESADAGKTAYYALRWVSTRGEKGPWSEVTSATVAA